MGVNIEWDGLSQWGREYHVTYCGIGNSSSHKHIHNNATNTSSSSGTNNKIRGGNTKVSFVDSTPHSTERWRNGTSPSPSSSLRQSSESSSKRGRVDKKISICICR